jgi:hypothetical protein
MDTDFTDLSDAAWHQVELEQLQRQEEEMKTSQMVQSKYLKKEDFPQPEILTVKFVSLEEVSKSDSRWVVYFLEKTKGIILNITKIRQLEAGFGDDTDNWIGKRIKVSNDPTVMMGQQVVGGIKFALPSKAVGAAPPPPPPPVHNDFDDDIPF